MQIMTTRLCGVLREKCRVRILILGRCMIVVLYAMCYIITEGRSVDKTKKVVCAFDTKLLKLNAESENIKWFKIQTRTIPNKDKKKRQC